MNFGKKNVPDQSFQLHPGRTGERENRLSGLMRAMETGLLNDQASFFYIGIITDSRSLTLIHFSASLKSGMKRIKSKSLLRIGGILQWSTFCLVTGVSLNSCNSEKNYTATAEDEKMAALEQQLDDVEKKKAQLMSGEIENNFELPGLGFYHSEAQSFYPHRYGAIQDGKWFANGDWVNQVPGAPSPAKSRPSEATLQKIQELLEKEQELAQSGSSSTHSSSGGVHHHHAGMGMGSMMMMYWMLSSNRGGFTQGRGFQYAQNEQQGWQQKLTRDRQAVSSYASSNPGYSKLVKDSKEYGKPVRTGSSVRGGFGGSSSSYSSGS